MLLVNPIRDGLNLVAKEGPAVNERDGQLVLSTEAGAFAELADAADAVLPFDLEQTAQRLAAALDREPQERRFKADEAPRGSPRRAHRRTGSPISSARRDPQRRTCRSVRAGRARWCSAGRCCGGGCGRHHRLGVGAERHDHRGIHRLIGRHRLGGQRLDLLRRQPEHRGDGRGVGLEPLSEVDRRRCDLGRCVRGHGVGVALRGQEIGGGAREPAMPAPFDATTFTSAGGTVSGTAVVVVAASVVPGASVVPSLAPMSTAVESSSKPTVPPVTSRMAPSATATSTRISPREAGSGPEDEDRRCWRWAVAMGQH